MTRSSAFKHVSIFDADILVLYSGECSNSGLYGSTASMRPSSLDPVTLMRSSARSTRWPLSSRYPAVHLFGRSTSLFGLLRVSCIGLWCRPETILIPLPYVFALWTCYRPLLYRFQQRRSTFHGPSSYPLAKPSQKRKVDTPDDQPGASGAPPKKNSRVQRRDVEMDSPDQEDRAVTQIGASWLWGVPFLLYYRINNWRQQPTRVTPSLMNGAAAVMNEIPSIHKAISSIGSINFADLSPYRDLPFPCFPADDFLVSRSTERLLSAFGIWVESFCSVSGCNSLA